MIIRSDFISNSSSCSFLVISDKGKRIKYNFNYQDILLPSDQGRMEFGREYVKISDIWSKLNFCAIQLIDLNDIEKRNHKKSKPFSFYRCYNMLKEVCSEELKLDISLAPSTDDLFCYIDHQSSITEGANMEMFESKENLISFLTNDESYIQLDSDDRIP